MTDYGRLSSLLALVLGVTVPIFSRLWHQLGAIGTASGWASLSS